MPNVIPTNPGVLLQVFETQLVAGLGLDTADPIYWRKDGDEPPEKPTGKRDLILVASRRAVPQGKQTGGGRLAFRFELLIEVHLRTIQLLDRVATSKDSLIDHWNQEDAVINSMLRVFPGDDANNALTIYGFSLDSTVLPHPDRMTPKWGASLGVWRCEYIPNIAATPYG